ncbi:MAG: hypothetical protein ABID40_01490 [Candidatus Bipolaricaulota bacterium]
MFAVPLLAAVLAAAQQPLPEQVGAINDYGQTLQRADRERLEGLVAALKGRGVSFVYLATWRDPFANLTTYTGAVFSAWRLPKDALLVVFLRGEDRRWRVEARFGERAAAAVPQTEWQKILAEAGIEANRAQPAQAVLNLGDRLLALLSSDRTPVPATERPWWWAYALAGLAGVAGLVLLVRSLLCPRCFRPLRRRASFRGIIRVCPRCRYTRAGPR